MTRKRKVFGRLKRVRANGKLFTFELTPDGLAVREWHQRRKIVLPLATLANHAESQPQLL